MITTVPHVTSGSGLKKFQADGFLFDRVYIYDNIPLNYSYREKCFRQKLYRKSKHTHFMLNSF